MHVPKSLIGAWMIASMLLTTIVVAQTATVSAVKSGDTVVITAITGSSSYKAIVDGKKGGDITQVSLPAGGEVVARELADIFFLGAHGEEYTLRGWTGPNKFTISCAVDVVSQKPDEVVVQVNLLTTGTVKVLVDAEPAKTNLRKAHPSYKDKTLSVKRLYTFKPDRIEIADDLLWIHPDMDFKTFYLTSAFMPGVIQGPARMINGAATASFNVTTSGGYKLPPGIAYLFAAENFLKNGYKVTVRPAAVSFDVSKSNFYYYEKPWQQDWFQLSGFMYKVDGAPAGKPIRASHEVVFSKATQAEMPPVVTIRSPGWDARWLDEKGEIAKYKIGDTVKLAATALNSDGTSVPDRDITWEIHIDPWWNTPAAMLSGSHLSYTLPQVVNEVDKAKSKDRNLLAVIAVRAKGKNGTEAVEPFAVLAGN